MRIAVIGAGFVFASLVCATFVAALVPSVGYAQRPAPASSGASAGLIALTNACEHGQQLTVVDPESRVLGVYHIDSTSGEIVLKSVRNIHWDLQMIEFNGTSPLPREIRSRLDNR
jgi:hypothetical protein